MKSKYKFELVDVTEVSFDENNPRIKKALEKYRDKITAERIYFSLRTASDANMDAPNADGTAVGTFSRLQDSILTNGSVTQPITVVASSKKKTCIDGNTRLAIYQDFLKTKRPGNWEKIPALVMHDASQKDIETIRVSAHLVGPRPWPAYEKARYLHYLHDTECMGFEELVALCGGNRRDIKRQIAAFNDMNDHYRTIVDDHAFDIDRFSGFVELQNDRVQKAIYGADFDLPDFGRWIRDGNISNLADVRNLPRVLADKEAAEIFDKGGMDSIERAMKHIDRKEEAASAQANENLTLENVPTHILAKTLAKRINEMPFSEVQRLQKSASAKDVEAVRIFADLEDRLSELLENVRKQ